MKAISLFFYLRINIVKLLDYKRYNLLVITRDDFLEQVKARSLKNLTSKKITKFIQEEIIYKYSLFRQLKVNSRLEFKKVVIQELNKLEINRIIISAYNFKGNSIIKREY